MYYIMIQLFFPKFNTSVFCEKYCIYDIINEIQIFQSFSSYWRLVLIGETYG